MNILIAEDSELSRNVLTSLLVKYGFNIIIACDGAEAVEQFKKHSPDLILMDLMMPVMNGYEATREIKTIAGDKFVPIIVLTSITETDSLVKSIEHGADDYLNKPYNAEAIHAKIIALSRIKALHDMLDEKSRELQAHNMRAESELVLAEHIYDDIVNKVGSDLTYLKSYMRPVTHFNGDIFMVSHSPSGGMHIMLGDFTGHGLSAAIGAIPASEVFYQMTKKGFSIGDIAVEMNSRLRRLLPVNMFCAACLIEVDPDRTAMHIWNGSMPDVVLLGPDGAVKQTISSSHSALGIEPDEKFKRNMDIISIEGNEKLYMCSDGVIDVRNSDGVKYGKERYFDSFARFTDNDDRFTLMVEDVTDYAIDGEICDDISLIEVDMNKDLDTWLVDNRSEIDSKAVPTTWNVELSLDSDTLKVTNPVPLLLNLVMGIQASHGHRERIYTVLSELFSNALEHGLLKLDSDLKMSPTGFQEYYESRESRLAELTGENITITISQKFRDDTGMITIHVIDSGNGFDLTGHTAKGLDENVGMAGRGIPLIRQICKTVEYNDAGNEVTAIYLCN